jgi:hypothetical protein
MPGPAGPTHCRLTLRREQPEFSCRAFASASPDACLPFVASATLASLPSSRNDPCQWLIPRYFRRTPCGRTRVRVDRSRRKRCVMQSTVPLAVRTQQPSAWFPFAVYPTRPAPPPRTLLDILEATTAISRGTRDRRRPAGAGLLRTARSATSDRRPPRCSRNRSRRPDRCPGSVRHCGPVCVDPRCAGYRGGVRAG